MTRAFRLLGLVVLVVACRSYDVADRTAAQVHVPPAWANQPVRPACYSVDGPDESCFGTEALAARRDAGGPDAAGRGAAGGDAGAPAAGDSPRPARIPATRRAPRDDRPWWRTLGDDDLARLVDRALAESPQSRLAMARVAQSRALARQSRAGQYPRLDAELSASRQRQVLAFPADAFGNAPGAPQGAVPETFEIGLYSARLVGTYEPDFFGRAGDEVRAREAEAEVSRIGVEEAHLSLAAEVSEAWFELIETRARTSLLQRQLEASRARLELMRDLYEHGLSRSLEVYQQRREVATALARLATVVGAEQVVKSRLSALVGVPYDKLRITAGTELPEPEPLREVGIPAEVVFHRPEVRAARQRLEAADRRVGAALAERLPSLRLQGTLGYGSREVQQLFDHVIWSVAATVTQPLWHGGEIDAAVEQGRALLEERVAEYRDAVLQATAQVESALAALQQARAELEALEAEVEVAQETLLESELLYQQGLADFLSVVDAERSLHAAQIERLRARRAWLSARVRLHQALGGDVQRGATAANSERRDGLDP